MTDLPQQPLTTARGFRAAGVKAGLKPSGSTDLALLVADRPCSAAGVFTTNRFPGAPVLVARQHLAAGKAQAIIVNAGCSNVATGQRGIDDANAMCDLVATHVEGIYAAEVLPCSTGVIGVPLAMDKISAAVPKAAAALDASADADKAFSKAILTTDLVEKHALETVTIDGKTIHIGGVAKGSGMIAPRMATMLSFITTDAAISPTLLQRALRDAVNASFNRITVDEDTSTSDAVLVLASGAAGNQEIAGGDGDFHAFHAALRKVCESLAYQVVKDGEGATRVFRVCVRNARTEADADRIGRTIAGSPLVKTAVHGQDPNWGRLIAAIGRSEAQVDPSRLRIHIGDICVFDAGGRTDRTPEQDKALDAAMTLDEVQFTIDLNLGDASVDWLGCDLSKQYVTINADYTT